MGLEKEIREEITESLNDFKEELTPKQVLAFDRGECPQILNAADIAEILKCSQRRAYDVMDRKDFPLIRIGKMKRVKRDSFLKWLNTNSTT